MFDDWREADREVAVIGLGRSGVAVSRLLCQHGVTVYASDKALPADEASTRDLEAEGVEVQLGGHDLVRIAKAAAVVVSPGVPPGAAAILAAKKAGTPVFAEIDVAVRALPSTTGLIGVTGTNGKTTTTSLTAHILEVAGLGAVAAGNIGQPLSEVAAESPPPSWAVVELSSFQLHDTPHLRLAVGMLLNLTPDHLDRYDSLKDYYADKANLFRNAGPDSVWVTNADDQEVRRMATGVPGTHLRFSLKVRHEAWYDDGSRRLMLGELPILARDDLRLLGFHNVANALAAALGAHAVGVHVDQIREALATFDPLPHRLEPIRVVEDVMWINDSKATNVVSTAMATAALDRPYVLLLGGRHKGAPYTDLLPTLGKCRAVVAFGEAAGEIVSDLGDHVPVHRETGFEEVLSRSRALAQAGDAVLLSPACSSFDMFASYEDRGRQFREAVALL